LKRVSFTFILVCIFLLSSCLGDLDTSKIGKLTINPSIAIPVINSTIGFIEFLSATDTITEIQTDSEGLISLVFDSGPLISQNLKSYINIPATTTTESINFSNQELASFPVNLQITKTDNFVLDLETDEGDLIDSVFLESGNLALRLTSSFPASGEITFRFLSLTDEELVKRDIF